MNFSKISVFFMTITFAAISWGDNLISVQDSLSYTVEEVAKKIEPGTIVILGESHAFEGTPDLDQRNQVKFIQSLIKASKTVSVGMEFVDYRFQDTLDEYLNKKITDIEFIINSNWGGNPLNSYKQQMLLPLQGKGWTYGLRASSLLSRAIGRKGLKGISLAQKAMLPPNFGLGSLIYEKRFYETIGIVHGDASGMYKNMYEAQCLWDDSMAWKAIEKLEESKSDVMIIIAGHFHARYGGGLEDRLRARGHKKILTIIQVESSGINHQEKEDLLYPHPEYGIIGDYIW